MAMTAPAMTKLAEQPDESELHLFQFVTFRMSRVQAKLNAQATRLLKERAGIGLVQWRMLALLGISGPTTAAVLTQLAEIDKGMFSRRLKSLVKAGLVTTTIAEDDQRQQTIALSREGQDLYQKTLPIMRRRQAILTSGMSDQQRRMFFEALACLEVNAQKEVV